jgi:hypothetical protein
MDSSDTPSAGVIDLAKLIDRFVALRDRKRELEQEHKMILRPYDQIMEEISAKLLKHMQEIGADHVASPGGTAYQTTKNSATIRDQAAFRNYVIEQGMFDLVDWRANANAVFEFINNAGYIPPGLNTSSYTKVLVRRPNEKE